MHGKSSSSSKSHGRDVPTHIDIYICIYTHIDIYICIYTHKEESALYEMIALHPLSDAALNGLVTRDNRATAEVLVRNHTYVRVHVYV
jgi:hypothetical protein